MPAKRDVAVVGVYNTKQERVSTRTPLALAMEALNGSLADAGMAMKDVDAWFGSFPGSIAYQFNIPVHHQANGTGSGALIEAAALIRDGLIETAVVPMGAARGPMEGKVAPWTRPELEFTQWTGEMTPAWWAIQMLSGVVVIPLTNTRRVATLMKNRMKYSLSPDAVQTFFVRKSHAQSEPAWILRNSSQLPSPRVGPGSSPASRRIETTVVRPTLRMPSFLSSPRMRV